LSKAERARLFGETVFIATESLRIISPEFGDPPRDWLIHQKWKREGVCPRHRTPLRKAMIGGRTTAWCTRCQK
jgi:formamidopyrimidine-DNA glycosylase